MFNHVYVYLIYLLTLINQLNVTTNSPQLTIVLTIINQLVNPPARKLQQIAVTSGLELRSGHPPHQLRSCALRLQSHVLHQATMLSRLQSLVDND